METVNFYNEYPTILSPGDSRLGQITQLEQLKQDRRLLIGTTIGLTLFVAIVIASNHYSSNSNHEEKKG